MREIPVPNVGAIQQQDQCCISNNFSDAADSMSREGLTTEGLLLGVRHGSDAPNPPIYWVTVFGKEALWLKEALQVCSNRDSRKAAGNLAVDAFVLLPENRHWWTTKVKEASLNRNTEFLGKKVMSEMKQVARTADWIIQYLETYIHTAIHTPTEFGLVKLYHPCLL